MKKLFLLIFFLMLSAKPVMAATYYVDEKNGSDSFDGSEASPFATIQKAADTVLAGDTVIVRDGIYYGPVNITAKGEEDAPIIFKAENPGYENVIITNANKTIRENINKNIWTLYDEEKNIYSAPCFIYCNAAIDAGDSYANLYPSRVWCDEVDLFPYESYENLENSMVTDTFYGYEAGFYYDHSAGTIYVRLDADDVGSVNPNDHIMKISPSAYPYISNSNLNKYGWAGTAYQYDAMGYDSFNVCIGEYNAPLPEEDNTRAPSYYVTLEGFTFENPGYCGVFFRASDCTVRGCWFRGCRAGVRGAARVRFNDTIYSDNIVVEYCDYSQGSVYSDAEKFIFENYNNSKVTANTYFWWQRKYGASGVMKQSGYEAGGLATHMGENWKIRYNYIHDCFDGLSYAAMRKYSGGKEGYESVEYEIPAEHIEIYGNKFERNLDNCIEFENRAYDIRVYENYFHNNFFHLSWQPLNGTTWPTNIRIYKNLIHNTPDFNEFWKKKAKYTPKVFKMGAVKSQWQEFPWMSDVEWDETYNIPTEPMLAEEDGFRAFNNTIIMPNGEFWGNVSGDGGTQMTFENFMLYNNFILSRPHMSTYNENGIMQAYVASGHKGVEFKNNIFAPDIPGDYVITDGVLDGGILLYGPDSAKFTKLTRLKADVTLKKSSPLIGAGTRLEGESNSKSYVGALGYGEENIFAREVGPLAIFKD